ncbi:hypothetical protein TrVFT333_004072 [Trichoderma virens FT-333]|nr:hypothetical protein TrVFT333_004072 [Trichoderma virens FT-333]
MATHADNIYKLEQKLEKETLTSIIKVLTFICQETGSTTEVVPVTRPDIASGSWVYQYSYRGINIIQRPEPVGFAGWREYDPNDGGRTSIVIHYSAVMNGDQRWEFQLSIYDTEKFWESLKAHGNAATDCEEYYKLLATLWSETYKVPFKNNRSPISARITKIETVNYPKADK